jgi:hypothetical protein
VGGVKVEFRRDLAELEDFREVMDGLRLLLEVEEGEREGDDLGGCGDSDGVVDDRRRAFKLEEYDCGIGMS